MSLGRVLRVFGRIGLVSVGALLATLFAEGAARVRTGQPLFSRQLVRVPTDPLVRGASLLALDPEVDGTSLPDIHGEWLADPPLPPHAPPPERKLMKLAAEARRNGLKGFEAFRIWNAEMVRQHGCDPRFIINRLPQPIPVFDPMDGGKDPPFRYLPGVSMPGGLVTNRFGFRGPDVPIDKPPATIRVAFVGASTTVGLWYLPWSYPELVVHWLNVWARENNLGVHFDGLNAGREGIGSSNIAAITVQEVLPLEPDIVVYYEGANQSLCTVPARDAPPRVPPRPDSWTRVDTWVAQWQNVSALARHARGAIAHARMQGAEPPKPELSPDSERDAYRAAPRLDSPSLPTRERTILRDLDLLRRKVSDSGAQLVLTSFEFLVSDGMQLDPQRDAVKLRHLNDWCWPYSYADVRRATDLHNDLMAAFATRYQITFIDVATLFPDDPRLFFDAFHLNPDGTRMHAWITFRGLVPLIRERLATGEWPRLDRTPQTTHPALEPPRLKTLNCEADASAFNAPGPMTAEGSAS